MSTNILYKIIGGVVALFLLLLVINTCSHRHTSVPAVGYSNYGAPAGYAQPAPVVVQGNSGPGFGTGAILGGAAGYFAGKASNNNAPAATAPAAQPAVAPAPAPAVSKFNRQATTVDNKVMPTLNKPAPIAAPAIAPKPSFSAPKATSFSSSGGSFSRRK